MIESLAKNFGFSTTNQPVVLGLFYWLLATGVFFPHLVWVVALVVCVVVARNTAIAETILALRNNALFWCAVVLLVLYLGGLLYTESTHLMVGLHTVHMATNVVLLMAVVVLAGADFWREHYRFMQRAFMALVVFVSLLCYSHAVWQMVSAGSLRYISPTGKVGGYYFFYTGLSSFFMHPGFLSLFVVVALLMLLHRVLHQKASKKQMLLLGYLGLFLFMLMGRGVLFSFVLVAGGYLVFYAITKRYIKLLGLMGAAVVAFTLFLSLAPFSMKKRFVDILNPSYDITEPDRGKFNGLTIRLATWHCATDVLANNKYVGLGTGDAKAALLQSYKANGYVVGVAQQYHTHNQIMEVWLKIGLLGVVALVALFAALFRQALKQKHFLLGSFGLIFFLAMQTDIYLDREAGLFLFAFWGTLWYLLPPKLLLQD